MCGVCAGRRGDVFLGDVIVADRVFSYDHGKIILAVSDDGIPVEEIFHDIATYNLKRTWHYGATYFSERTDWCSSLVGNRPLSLDFQRRWLLRFLLENQDQISQAKTDSIRETYCPRWPGWSPL